MKKWTQLFDADRCNGCCNCVLATMDEYVGNSHAGYSAEMPREGTPWFTMQVVERGADQTVDIAYSPQACRHCEDAPCIKSAPDAVTRRADGIVMIDPILAKGARRLVDACPFGAIHWNEELQLPQHWNLDAHLLDAGWREPRASQACPTGALQVVRLEKHEVDALSTRGFSQSEQDVKFKSRLFVKGMDRLTSELLGGSVAQESNGRQEPVFPARVFLEVEGVRRAETCTDELGGFRFDVLYPLTTHVEIVVEDDVGQHRWIRSRDPVDGRYHVGVLHFHEARRD